MGPNRAKPPHFRVKGLLHNGMKKTLALLSSTCAQVVNWFDGTLRTVTDLVLQLSNVAIRALMAYALYALFAKDLLLKVVDSF